ncbi:MAG TPA: OsmC family protein [Chthoniobacterales bacterium]
MNESASAASLPPAVHDVVVHGSASGFAQEINVGRDRLIADEPLDYGGTATGPTPYDYLLAALGSCTSMTIGWYARRKKWPLQNVKVSMRHEKIHATDCEECETKEGKIDRIEMDIELTGELSSEQREKLLAVASMCPVHRTLTSEVQITKTLR